MSGEPDKSRSSRVEHSVKYSLTPGQSAVLRAFYEFGKAIDDQALTVYVHHVEDDGQSSSGIRSRRAELCRPTEDRPALLHAIGTKRLRSGRRAAIHTLTAEGRSAAKALFGAVTA